MFGPAARSRRSFLRWFGLGLAIRMRSRPRPSSAHGRNGTQLSQANCIASLAVGLAPLLFMYMTQARNWAETLYGFIGQPGLADAGLESMPCTDATHCGGADCGKPEGW